MPLKPRVGNSVQEHDGLSPPGLNVVKPDGLLVTGRIDEVVCECHSVQYFLIAFGVERARRDLAQFGDPGGDLLFGRQESLQYLLRPCRDLGVFDYFTRCRHLSVPLCRRVGVFSQFSAGAAAAVPIARIPSMMSTAVDVARPNEVGSRPISAKVGVERVGFFTRRRESTSDRASRLAATMRGR